jgi:hypothetical protein
LIRPGLVLARTPGEIDELSAKVLLGGECVVGAAAQREIGLGVLTSLRECRHMVELEAVSLSATPSRAVGVGAASFVALEDGAPDESGDVSTAPARALGLGLGVLGGIGFALGPRLGPGLRRGLERGSAPPASLRPRARQSGCCQRPRVPHRST